MTTYYKKGVIYPGVLIVLGYCIYGIIDIFFGEKYQSEWLTKESVLFVAILMVTANALFMGFLSLPIFLNLIPKVRSNLRLSFLSWFLCPCIYITTLWTHHFYYLTHYSDIPSDETIKYEFSNTFGYLIGLSWTFIQFRRDLKINQDLTNN